MALYHAERKILIGTQAKCGSTSLEKMLRRQPDWSYVLPKHLPPDPTDWPAAKHLLIQVRHPLARFRSIYRWNVKRAPHEALSEYVDDIDVFVEQFIRRWRAKCWKTFTSTQAEYRDAMGATGYARLEDGGLSPTLRELGLDVPDLPVLNANRDDIEMPEMSRSSAALLEPWLCEDYKAFNY